MTLACDECLLCRKSKTNKTGSGHESLRTCITGASAECLLDYGNKSIDEYVSPKPAGHPVNEVIAKEFKYHQTCNKKMSREIIHRATIAKTEREIYGKSVLKM